MTDDTQKDAGADAAKDAGTDAAKPATRSKSKGNGNWLVTRGDGSVAGFPASDHAEADARAYAEDIGGEVSEESE